MGRAIARLTAALAAAREAGAFALAGAAVEFHAVIGVDPGAEGLEQARRQTRAIIDGLQPQRTGVMHHQPGAVMGCVGKFGQPIFEHRHLTPRQSAQQQRCVQDATGVQLGHEGRQIGADAGLIRG